MKTTLAFCIAMLTASMTLAREAHPFPKTLPPVVATAVATSNSDSLTLAVSYPQPRWELVGEVVPKEQWPQLNVELERKSQTIVLGGPSALAESSVVDIHGKELTRDEIAKRLAQQTLVLIAVDGKFPSSYYLTMLKPETLIIQLGPRDGAPAPRMLPAEKRK